MRRVVFAWCDSPDFEDVARDLCPDVPVSFRPDGLLAAGPTVYVAFDEEQVGRYGVWFPGLEVRVQAVVRAAPLPAGGVVYLPVSFDSWVVVGEGASCLGAAFEAASLLPRIETVVVPAFDPSEEPGVRASLGCAHRRRQDRVYPVT